MGRGLSAGDLLRMRAGDESAFVAFYLHHLPGVRAYLTVALRNPHDVEEVAQQAFFQVLGALPRLPLDSKEVRVWLFTIVRNCAITYSRRQRRTTPTQPADLDGSPSRNADPHETASALWGAWSELHEALRLLPRAQHEVIVLGILAGLEAREIAQTLGRTVTDVRQLRHRGLEHLRKRFGPTHPERNATAPYG